MKKIVKWILLIICFFTAFLIINISVMIVKSKEEIDINYKKTDAYVNAVGGHSNCIVFEKKNTLSKAPFIFGWRLCLYDIDRDKEYYITHTNRLFQEFERNYVFRNGFVYYERTGVDGESSDTLEMYDTVRKEIISFRQLDHWCTNYSLADDFLIYSSCELDIGNECLVKMDMESGDKTFMEAPDDYNVGLWNVEVHDNTIFAGCEDDVFRYDLDTCEYLGREQSDDIELQQIISDDEEKMIEKQFPDAVIIYDIRKEILEDYYVYDVLYDKKLLGSLFRVERTKVFVFDKCHNLVKVLQ